MAPASWEATPGKAHHHSGSAQGCQWVPFVVVTEGESTGCTGYVLGLVFYFQSAPKRARDPSSPCWTTKQEMGLVKATVVEAGNPTEAREQSQKVGERIKECHNCRLAS
jgi:hypothetical protein